MCCQRDSDNVELKDQPVSMKRKLEMVEGKCFIRWAMLGEWEQETRAVHEVLDEYPIMDRYQRTLRCFAGSRD